MKLDDGQLLKELYCAKSHMKELIARKAPNSVVQRAEFQVEILEELILWRENGRRWLKFMNAGKENHGQIQQFTQGVNKINS